MESNRKPLNLTPMTITKNSAREILHPLFLFLGIVCVLCAMYVMVAFSSFYFEKAQTVQEGTWKYTDYMINGWVAAGTFLLMTIIVICGFVQHMRGKLKLM